MSHEWSEFMAEAQICDGNVVSFSFNAPDGTPVEVTAPLIHPADVERATGKLRLPELMVDLTAQLATWIAGAASTQLPEITVGLLVHTVSHRAAAIGPFSAPEAATVWWYQPFNRLARNDDIVFVVVPVVSK
jgi:hypothetical protein